jgi:hypothetical protein
MPGPERDIIAEHAEMIGRVAIAWADLDQILGNLFELFSGLTSDKARAIYFLPKSDRAQREMLRTVAKIALESHPDLWLSFKSAMDGIDTLSGERNAAIHQSWGVQFPDPTFVPSHLTPTHKALKDDFVTQFQSLRTKLGDKFFELLEVRKEFRKRIGVT